MLIFATEVKCEPVRFSMRAETRVVIEAFLIGTAIVIDNSLAEVKTITQRVPLIARSGV